MSTVDNSKFTDHPVIALASDWRRSINHQRNQILSSHISLCKPCDKFLRTNSAVNSPTPTPPAPFQTKRQTQHGVIRSTGKRAYSPISRVRIDNTKKRQPKLKLQPKTLPSTLLRPYIHEFLAIILNINPLNAELNPICHC
jgi:hypothetical protein